MNKTRFAHVCGQRIPIWLDALKDKGMHRGISRDRLITDM